MSDLEPHPGARIIAQRVVRRAFVGVTLPIMHANNINTRKAILDVSTDMPLTVDYGGCGVVAVFLVTSSGLFCEVLRVPLSLCYRRVICPLMLSSEHMH